MCIGFHLHGHSAIIFHHSLSQQATKFGFSYETTTIIKYEITADVPEIKKLISEFGKIGSNLNQIARYFNQCGIISTEMKNEIRKSLRDIYEMKYEVMKMAGDFRGSN